MEAQSQTILQAMDNKGSAQIYQNKEQTVLLRRYIKI